MSYYIGKTVWFKVTFMSVTLSKIAEKCRVSKQTVSQILRNPDHPRFLLETKQIVLETAKKLNYIPNTSANLFRKGKTQLIALVIPWNIPELMDSAERVCRQYQYNIMIQFTPEPEIEAELQVIRNVLQRRVDGLIWMPSKSSSEYYKEVKEQIAHTGIQVVFLETGLEGFSNSTVLEFDYLTAYGQAVDYLAQQGYRRVVYVTQAVTPELLQRVDYFSQATSGHPIAHSVWAVDAQHAITPSSVTDLIRKNEPVVFLCENDWYAFDLMKIVKATGTQIPGNVGLMMVGDLLVGNRFHLGELTTPTISSIPRPFGKMAQRAIEILVQQAKGIEPAQSRRELIPMQVLPRETTALNSLKGGH